MKAKQIALILIPLNIILAYFVFNSINGEIEFNKEAEERITENVQKLKDLRQVQIAYKKVNNTYANNFELLLDFLENDSMVIVKAIGETPDSLTDVQALELGIISRDTIYIDAESYIFNEMYKTIILQKDAVHLSIKTLKDELKSITESVSSGNIELNELGGNSTEKNRKQTKLLKDKLLELGANHKKLSTAKNTLIKKVNEIEKEINNKKTKYPLSIKQLRFIPHTESKSYNIDAGQVEKGKVAVQVFEISTTYAAVFTGLDAENKSYELDNLLKVGSMDEASINGNWGE